MLRNYGYVNNIYVLFYFQILLCDHIESVNRLDKSGFRLHRMCVFILELVSFFLNEKEVHFEQFQSVPEPNALPAGLTCLKEAAAGMPKASLSSFTSCQAFKASHKFINPGAPFRTTYKNIYTLPSRVNKVRYIHFLKHKNIYQDCTDTFQVAYD